MPQKKRQRTPAFKIVFYTYRVRVPQMFLINQDVVDEYGYPTSGDSAVDFTLAQSREDAVLTPLSMARIYADGGGIEFTEPKKLPEIYQMIYELLKAWEQIANHPIKSHQYDIPVDLIEILDQYATAIFELARPFMTTQPTASRLSQSLSRLSDRLIVKRAPIGEPDGGHKTAREAERARQKALHHEPIAPSITRSQFQKTHQPEPVKTGRKNRSAYEVPTDHQVV